MSALLAHSCTTLKCKTGNTSNMIKHLIVHGVNLRADDCTVFKTPPPQCRTGETSTTSTGPPDCADDNGLTAQKLYTEQSVAKWAARIRAVVEWLRRTVLTKPVLKEKQLLLHLPKHSLVLDVKTRWKALYLMVERFIEQYPAIQAVSMDPRLRRSMERDRILQLAARFCQSCRSWKTTSKFKIARTAIVKRKVWDDLSKRYNEQNIRAFLDEATAMDLRFKAKVQDAAVWARLEEEACFRWQNQRQVLQRGLY
ncbi:hypothetical protein SKAU_G00283510 [Synaphobranchus kaupii]|uniref:Uncharacterized protein n=1 Tax=Synaphobranchus kaupii TaxID=118154 RepID=A0A9Q1EXM1_SYNKA|nr:hypothetical protein SKAU_G00283510 [Synaphobranchus kaupii]